MAALGSAASMIAHEVKNSLNGLKGATSLISIGGDPALAAASIRGQVDRLAHLASSLLSFGKPASARLSPTRLDEVAKEAVEGLKVLPEAAEVTLRLQLSSPITVEGDPLLLVSALDNLIRNAIEAAVASKDLGKNERPEVSVAAIIDGEMAVLTVEDNAGGPPANFEANLFQPFVSSKPKGIGLGLAMAHRALEQQGGSLSFSRTPAGSRFTARLKLRP